MGFMLSSTMYTGLTSDKLKACRASVDTRKYVCLAKIGKAVPAPPAPPPYSGAGWRKVGTNVYGSARRGSNIFPPYHYGSARDAKSCSEHCKDLHRCIGFTFRGSDSRCYLWLSNPTWSLGFSGWYYSTRGTKGLMPAKLLPGRAESSSLMLVTYAALTHKLSSGADDTEFELPEDVRESTVEDHDDPTLPKDEEVKPANPGEEGLEEEIREAQTPQDGDLMALSDAGADDELRTAMAEHVASTGSDSESSALSQDVNDPSEDHAKLDPFPEE